MTSDTEPEGVVKSDQTLFSIIECLQQQSEMGVTELSEKLDMSKSSVHKHLKTLAQNGYVQNDGGRYRLGFKFLTLGGFIRDRNKFCNYARPAIENVADETDHMVSFILREDVHGVFVFIRNDHYGLRKPVPLGNRFPLHQNGSGKSILAKMSDDQIESFVERTKLPAATGNTITDENELWEEIDTVREQGYAISNEERVEGVQSVAAAVENPKTGDVGSITIIGPADHLTQEHIHSNYAEMLVEVANELELRMRYTEE